MRAETNEQQTERASLLSSFRVLDLTDEKGMLCGKLMASMGADVIKVERPAGDAARNLPPFFRDMPHPEESITYSVFNTNKKSITLNIETADGQALLKRLVSISDFVIESFQPGYMDRLGLGYSDLAQTNPRIILTSITPFGQKGPYSQFKSSDLLCMGMSGLMYLIGDPDGTPARISVPQAYSMGATEGLAATMIAHYVRERTGEGQHADVSIRDSLIKTTIAAVPECEQNDRIMKRGGKYWVIRFTQNRMLWPCKDGWVTFRLAGGAFAAKTNTQLIAWLASENMASEYLQSFDWAKLDMEKLSKELYAEVEASVGRFFLSHSKQELFEGALSRGIMLLPVSTVAEIAHSPQLAFRDFWDRVEHPDLGMTINYPGAFIKASETPLEKTTRAPHVGEHNAEIYTGLLGLARDELVLLKGAGVI